MEYSHTKSNFSGIQIPEQARPRNEGRNEGRALKCGWGFPGVLVTFGIHRTITPRNPVWGPGHKVARINLGVHHAPAWGTGLGTYILQFQAGDSNAHPVWHSQTCPRSQGWLSAQPGGELSSPSPGARAPGSLFHGLYLSTVSSSENENENNGLIEISGLRGLNDLGKRPVCLCAP